MAIFNSYVKLPEGIPIKLKICHYPPMIIITMIPHMIIIPIKRLSLGVYTIFRQTHVEIIALTVMTFTVCHFFFVAQFESSFDGLPCLPNLKMGGFSMANCECHNQRVSLPIDC